MLTVRSILAQKGRAIFYVTPDSTVLDALREMAAHNVGALIVLDGDRAVGLFSERDYARKVILMGRVSATTSVREVMDAKVATVPLHSGIEQCMATMTECRSRHLLVCEGDRLAGVISIGDVVKALLEDQRATIEQLEHYITGG